MFTPDPMKPVSLQPRDERDALNLHGVFLKKRVLEEVRKAPRMGVFAEEFGVAFNEPVAVDVIGVDKREDRQLLFVFECKRAYTKEKTWVFFRDFDPTFRLCRAVSPLMQFGHYTSQTALAGTPAVCSEGYELVASDNSFRADQKPIYEAGNQLSKGFLGFVQTRLNQQSRVASSPNYVLDCILPVLVTTAELRIAEFDVSQISLRTGNLEDGISLTPCDWLILKQPFSVAAGESFRDFRNNPPHVQDQENWRQVHRESLLVVNSAKLPEFLNGGFRDNMHNLRIR